VGLVLQGLYVVVVVVVVVGSGGGGCSGGSGPPGILPHSLPSGAPEI